MTEIIIAKTDPHDVDAPKDCEDFVPLSDGTKIGDRKYCDRSKECRQYDPITRMGYLSEWHEWREFYINEKGELVEEDMRDYLCTGKFPIFQERCEDERAK
jgi:hypothetical protein